MSDVFAAAVPTPARQSAIRRVAGFAAVGTVGFVVDSALTLLMITFGIGAFLARALAIAVAMATTYLLNRTLTFSDSADRDPSRIAGEATRYVMVAIAAAAFNWGIYSVALIAIPGLPPFFAIVAGSGAAMVASYLGYSRFAFRSRGDRDSR